MSELTSCNFCNFNRIKRSANAKGLKVTKIPCTNQMGGIDILVHPKGLKVNAFKRGSPSSKQLRNRYFAAWFMELPDHCCC